MEKGLLEKTGEPLDHWVKVVKQSKIEKHKAIIDFLKAEHGFTHGFANFVALKARKADAASMDPADLVATQYSKGKEDLQPIYKKLRTIIQSFGDDITVTQKKDSVSFIRKRQFALIKPATKTRIDLGLKIKGKPTTARLENSGPFGAMCSHRVRLESLEAIDAELLAWLKEAYEGAA
jgi:predicted transport protein